MQKKWRQESVFMENERIVVCSENGQNQLEFLSLPFRYKLIKNSDVFLDCRGGCIFIRTNNLILNPSMIVESWKENHETILKISLKNSELFLILTISSFKGNFKLKWQLEDSHEAADFGMRYLLQPGEKFTLTYQSSSRITAELTYAGTASAEFVDPFSLSANPAPALNITGLVLPQAAVPEPGSAVLLLAGAALLCLARRLGKFSGQARRRARPPR